MARVVVAVLLVALVVVGGDAAASCGTVRDALERDVDVGPDAGVVDACGIRWRVEGVAFAPSTCTLAYTSPGEKRGPHDAPEPDHLRLGDPLAGAITGAGGPGRAQAAVLDDGGLALAHVDIRLPHFGAGEPAERSFTLEPLLLQSALSGEAVDGKGAVHALLRGTVFVDSHEARARPVERGRRSKAVVRQIYVAFDLTFDGGIRLRGDGAIPWTEAAGI